MSRRRVNATNRFLAMVLSLVMILSVIPVASLQAMAATTDYVDSFTVTVKGENGPAEGANVTLQSADDTWTLSLSALTDAKGVAAFDAAEIQTALTAAGLESGDVTASVTMDGYEATSASMTFNAADAAQNLDIQLTKAAPREASVSVTVTGNATVRVNKKVQNSATVPIGAKVPVEIVPEEGAYIKSLTVNGSPVEVKKGNAYSATIDVTADVVINAAVVREFTVTAPAIPNGEITLNGHQLEKLTVDEGTAIAVKVIPNKGYQIGSVSIGGVAQTLEDEYNFAKSVTITDDTKIEVTFVKVYTVTVTKNGSGTIVTDPEGGTVTVKEGKVVTITATPDGNNRVSKVEINAVPDKSVKGENNSGYTKELVADQDYTIVITFAPNRYKVTVESARQAHVTLSADRVEHNGSCDVRISLDEGYNIDTILVNGVEVSSYKEDERGFYFTMPSITEDKHIAVTVQPIQVVESDVTRLFNAGDAVRVDGNTFVFPKDSTVKFDISNSEYRAIRLKNMDGKHIAGGFNKTTATLSKTVDVKYVELRKSGSIRWSAINKNPLHFVIDTTAVNVELSIDKPNANGFYTNNFNVKIDAVDPEQYSGLAAVEYFVTATEVNGDYDSIPAEAKTQSGVLYTHSVKLSDHWNGSITVDAAKNNSDHVVIWVKATDRAGNVSIMKSENLKVNITAPELVSVNVDGAQQTGAAAGFYAAERTATVTITDRASAFNEEAANNGIAITAVDGNNEPVAISKTAMISWTHSGDTHVATITFHTDAYYTWSVDYTNLAGLTMTSDKVVETGTDLYKFTLDTHVPQGSISVESEKTWDKLLSSLSFGFWRNYTLTATAELDKDLSPVFDILYYKSNSQTALTEPELEALYAQGLFVKEPIVVENDEAFAVYARFMDYAGNVRYISTDGLIVDKTPSVIQLIPDQPNGNGMYNKDVNVHILVNELMEGQSAYSGIKTIDYEVVVDDEVKQEGNLYSFSAENPQYSDLNGQWSGDITVDSKICNADNVKVIVTVMDNAGTKSTKTLPLSINIDEIKASIVLDGEANRIEDGRGYFNVSDRVATIVITDRASAFDEAAATAGISVTDDKGQPITTGYTVSAWSHEGDKHTATVTFSENANYKWAFAYTNKAGNTLDLEKNLTTGDSETPFVFTVDDSDPTGTISINDNTWDKLLNVLTFGIYNRIRADIHATAHDDISPVEMEYYKTSQSTALSVSELEKLYAEGRFQPYTDFTIDESEQFVVYLKITDYAGRYTFISTNVAVVDKSPSNIMLIPENANENGIYGQAYTEGVEVEVKVTDAAPYSGIKTIDYTVTVDNDTENPVQSGNLYTFNVPEATHGDLVNDWSGKIVVDPALNNSCDVTVTVTVKDNADNVSSASKSLDIDVTAPVIQVSYDNNADNKGNGYFKDNDNAMETPVRTATVVITERTHHFDAEAATKGVVVTAVDAQGEAVEDSYILSPWKTEEGTTPDAATHTATITFVKDANYAWSIAYTDKAGNENEGVDTGSSVAPFAFTIDTKAPYGTVKAVSTEGRETVWDSLREELSYGFWSKEQIQVTGTSGDETSAPIAAVDYYKVSASKATDGTTALTAAELDAVTGWTAFDGLKFETDEQFVIYVRITDLAGNYAYISTNGLIVDHNSPHEEAIAPEITVTPEAASEIYNGDVKVSINVADPLVGGTYSGLRKIWYEVKNLGDVTQTGTLFEFSNEDPRQEDLIPGWKGQITVDSKLNNSNNVEIVIHAMDNAANDSESSLTIKIDTTAPTILVRYDNNTPDSGSYFKADRTATVIVTERNFNPDAVITAITNTDGAAPKISNFVKRQGAAGGNGDDTTWTATVYYGSDGDYTFDIACADMAGNPCSEETFAEGTMAGNKFTIDKTVPVISVSYDNNDYQNGNYFKAERTATISITEHNLQPNGADRDRIVITTTAADDGTEIVAPGISGWSTYGDRHTATITYSADAHYTFDIAVKDKAGNDAADFAAQDFYVDKTAPKLEITGVKNSSANKGKVSPVVTYSDTNFDASQVQITLTGANRKDVKLDGSYENIHNGQSFTFKNFAEKKESDDIYVLTAMLTDKAGNVSTQTINFSVNRFGSTYAMSTETEKLNGTYTQKPVDVVVTETNPNKLSNVKVTLFKNNETLILAEGKDYKLDVAGGKGEWYVYTYTIFAENFADDAVYRLSFHSEDEAGNIAENTLDTKDMEMGFGVDKTRPNIIVTNLEKGKTYALDNMKVLFSADDNLLLTSVTVYLDDYETVYRTWTAEEIAELTAGGDFSFDISGDSKGAHNVKIVCVDAAGNEQVEEITGFYVTTDIFVRYFNNKPLFYGSIAGVIVAAGLFVFLLVYKKKKEEK